jgi:Glycosyltransferase like family
MSEEQFTVIVAVNDRKVLQQNLLLSPGLANGEVDQLLIQEGFPSASLAYNQAIDQAMNDLLVFVHQDIYLPDDWFHNVRGAIRTLEEGQKKWGILGSFGSTGTATGGLGMVYTTGFGLHGNAIKSPEPAETLDEIIIIMRKSSGLRFDLALPHFHMYGVDICLAARSMGLTNFAIPAFCVHNTNQLLRLPSEFYIGYRYVKRKWSRHLPIYTSCMTISRFDLELFEKKISELLSRLFFRKIPRSRIEDPRVVMPADYL